MSNLFDSDQDPFERLTELEREMIYLIEQDESISGRLVNNSWLLEQVTSHMVTVTDAINDLYKNQKILETQLKEIKNASKD